MVYDTSDERVVEQTSGAADPGAPANVDLAELADEMRVVWRTLTRDVHLSSAPDQAQRQQSWVLGVLSKGPLRMSELAERACTSQASLTGIVDRLEALGFAERVRSASDRRVVDVALTGAGREELARLNAEIAARFELMLEPLSPDERRQLLGLFRKMSRPACRVTEL